MRRLGTFPTPPHSSPKSRKIKLLPEKVWQCQRIPYYSPMIHIGTVIQTVFGLVDDKGNVVQKIPIQCEVNSLDQETFTKAVEEILKKRDEMVTQAVTQEPASKKANGRPSSKEK